MIVIPWFVRMAIDTTIISIPFYWIYNNPTLFYTFAEPQNRLMRKRIFEDYKPIDEKESFMTPAEVKALYERIGFAEHN
jgi:hypothetical protein